MVDFTKNKSWFATQVIEDDADTSNVGKIASTPELDLNTLDTSGFFHTDSSANTPVGFNNGEIIHCAGVDATFSAQFAFDHEVSKSHFRVTKNSVPQPWNEIYHTGNAASLPLTTAFAPEDDNVRTLGDAAGRWSEVFAGNGAINTSDAREKTEISPFTFDEIEASKQLANEIGTYQFLASVEAKGESARTHIGLTVQRAVEIMSLNNLDPMSYGFICFNSWDEEVEAILDSEGEEVLDADDQPTYKVIKEAGDRYGFRYDQLNQFIIAGFNARLEAAGI